MFRGDRERSFYLCYDYSSMIRDYPSYYKEFRCIAGRCPDTCCAGWEVDLDEEAWYRYLVVKGSFGEKLRRVMKEDGDYRYFQLTPQNRCPFLTRDNLCELYQKLGEESLCVTCREHPRYYQDVGDYEQADLSLGCPEAARLFLADHGRIRYCREESKPLEAASFLDQNGQLRGVLAERDRVLEVLQDGTGSLAERMRAAGVWQPEAETALIRLAERLEPLNGIWKTWVSLLKEKTWKLEKLPGRQTREAAIAGDGQQPPGEEIPEIPETALRRLACYLVFRYWIDAYYEREEQDGAAQDYQPEVRLLNRFLGLIRLLYRAVPDTDRLVRVVYVASRTIEFNEDNVALMKQAL